MTRAVPLMVLILALGAAGDRLRAQSDYRVRIQSASGPVGGTARISTRLDNTGPVYGWSWGVCGSDDTAAISQVAPGSGVLALQSGTGPDFYGAELFPGGGWTTGAIVDFDLDETLAPGVDHEMDLATYTLLQPGETPLCFCDTLMPGADPIATLVAVDGNGTTVSPEQRCGSITVGERFIFDAPAVLTTFDRITGDGSFRLVPTIADDASAPGYPLPTRGFSMGLSHDETLLEATAVIPAPILENLNAGQGAEFFAEGIYEHGITVAAVFGFQGEEIEFPTPTAVIEISYSTRPSAFAGRESEVFTQLQWTNTLGDLVPVENNVVVDPEFFIPLLDHGPVALFPDSVPTDDFRRGDFDGDGSLGLGDALNVLNFLFVVGGPVALCEDAVDVDDDGVLGLPDPLTLLNFLFVPASPSPAPPHPDCGPDPTGADPLGCASHPACP